MRSGFKKTLGDRGRVLFYLKYAGHAERFPSPGLCLRTKADDEAAMRRSYPATAGVILAGGAGKRIGGDKAFRELAGKSLLLRATERLGPQCAEMLISAHNDASHFSRSKIEVVLDEVREQAGPLAGILAALDRVADVGRCEWMLSAPVDCPFLPVNLAARLHTARELLNAPIAAARSRHQTHPVVALWHVSLRAALYDAVVGRGVRKVGAFVAQHPHAVADWDVDGVDPFFNINTPEDLNRAEEWAAGLSS